MAAKGDGTSSFEGDAIASPPHDDDTL